MRAQANCYLLDVGHGNATLIEGRTGAALVDAGKCKIALLNFLESRGIQALDAIFISHADADHIGGLQAVLSKANTDTEFRIGHIYVNPDSRDTKAWGDLAALLEDMEDRKLLQLTPNLGVGSPERPLDLGGCSVELIAPSKYMRLRAVGGKYKDRKTQDANTLSAVIHVKHESSGWLLLPGDLDHLGLDDAVNRTAWKTAPVVVFPHHGGSGGTAAQTKELASAIIQHTQSTWVLFSSRSHSELFPSELVIDTIMGLAPQPIIVSIGDSPVLKRKILPLTTCQHLNDQGTLLVSPPDPSGVVRISSYSEHQNSSSVFN